ncbi:unnamed protein product, partial [Choristocarpus tenellus]
KRERDIVALRDFQASLAVISDNMEGEVLAASCKLRDDLNVVEEEVKSALEELGQDEGLVQQLMPYLEDMWLKLEGMCSNRSAYVKQFGDRLEGVERQRSEAVGLKLRGLVDEMIAIAFRLPEEVEHVAEVGKLVGETK